MDHTELQRLLRLIRENGHEASYLPRTREELVERYNPGHADRVLAYILAKPMIELPKQGTVLACVPLANGEALLLPDNKTAPCAWGCGRTVQFRPWVPSELQRVCLYCVAERKDDN